MGKVKLTDSETKPGFIAKFFAKMILNQFKNHKIDYDKENPELAQQFRDLNDKFAEQRKIIGVNKKYINKLNSKYGLKIPLE